MTNRRKPQPPVGDILEASTMRDNQVSRKTSVDGSRKRTGLYRPTKPRNFQITAAQQPTKTTTAASTTAAKSTVPSAATPTLEKLVLLLDLIHRRNKNQHRAQVFFKHLSLLRSSLKRLLEIQLQLDKLSQETTTNAESVRRKFEQESQMRGRKELFEEHIRETLVPMCFVSFSGLVGDSQFANLGAVLFGLLAEIAAGEDKIGVPKRPVGEGSEAGGTGRELAGRNEEAGKELGITKVQTLLGMSTRVTGEDQGEIIERVYESGNDGEEVDVPAGTEQAMGSGGNEEKEWIPRASTKQGDRSRAGAPGRGESIERRALAVTEAKNGAETRPRKKKKRNAIDDLFNGLV